MRQNISRTIDTADSQSVVVTYRGSTYASSPFDGEPIAVEFVKQEEK
jgi:hypothetical protein